MGRYSAPLPGQFAWKPFRVADAHASGIGYGRLRSRELMRPVRGVRAPADADVVQRCRALLLHRPAGMAFSHATAAHLFGAPLPSRLAAETRIHVSVAAPARAPQITGVVGHVTSRLDIAVREGLPVTAPEQTWLDLASCLRRDELVMVGDFFLAQRSTSMDALAHALQSASGRRGVSSARAALPLLREGSESPAESALRVQLHDAGLVPPELNYRIHDRDGSFIARVDMAYPDQRVVIEYEGDYHRVDRAQWHKDIHRQARLEDRGWRVIRATASDLADPADLILRVRRALTRET